jgi:hypothetical protein
MKQVINIYRKHKLSVDSFISTFIRSIPQDCVANASSIFDNYKYVQLIYGVDQAYKQSTPIIYRKESDDTHIGSDKSHYFNKGLD